MPRLISNILELCYFYYAKTSKDLLDLYFIYTSKLENERICYFQTTITLENLFPPRSKRKVGRSIFQIKSSFSTIEIGSFARNESCDLKCIVVNAIFINLQPFHFDFVEGMFEVISVESILLATTLCCGCPEQMLMISGEILILYQLCEIIPLVHFVKLNRITKFYKLIWRSFMQLLLSDVINDVSNSFCYAAELQKKSYSFLMMTNFRLSLFPMSTK